MAKRFMTRYGFARIVTILGLLIWEIRPKVGKETPLTAGIKLKKMTKRE